MDTLLLLPFQRLFLSHFQFRNRVLREKVRLLLLNSSPCGEVVPFEIKWSHPFPASLKRGDRKKSWSPYTFRLGNRKEISLKERKNERKL